MPKQTAINPIIEEIIFITAFIMLLIALCSPIFLLWLYIWKKHLGNFKTAIKRSLINFGIFLVCMGLIIIIQNSYGGTVGGLIFLIPISLIFVLCIYWKNYTLEFFKRGKSLRKK
jgi:hypothetical protein